MENNIDIKTQIKISKPEEEKENNKNEKNNAYSKISNLSQIENEPTDNDDDIGIEIDNDIFTNYNHENDLTQSQIERLNKIREEAQLRSEKYSDLSSNSNLIIKNLNNSNNIPTGNNINISNNNDPNDSVSNLTHNFINNEDEDNQNNEINPNLERIFSKIHPFLFFKNEPLILIGPDILYYVIIFSISSFFSIIFYSLKNKSYTIMKILFLLGYLFYAITYILLMILNPGVRK